MFWKATSATYEIVKVSSFKVAAPGDRPLKYQKLSRMARFDHAEFVPIDIVLIPMSCRCSRVVRYGKGFVAIWIPVDLTSGLSP